ncbi:MAG: helicase-related protein, partial [Thermoplasmataceae archaeon]
MGESEISYIPAESDRYEDLLTQMLPLGVCFHHAGLSNNQRTSIEGFFRDGKVKVLVATPTLAAGVNLPARTVIIRDITRFSDGMIGYISSTEVHQMLGRAGRPKYDTVGYGLIYASTENAYDHATQYLESDPEPLESSLNRESLIRFNVMALISTGLCSSLDGIFRFYRTTLLGLQQEIDQFSKQFSRTLSFLVNNGFVTEKEGRYAPTKLGKAASDLYIDPMSAVILKKYLDSGEINDVRSLVNICLTPEVMPLLARSDDLEEIEYFIRKNQIDVSQLAEDYAGRIKTAMVLLDWISESSMERMEEKYNIGPGDVQAKVSSAQWISYSLARLASMYLPEKRRYFEILNIRITEGIREEIWEIITIPNIGRVRGRRLYNAGFKSLEQVAGASVASISKIVGFSDKLASDTISHAQSIISRRKA